MDGIGDYVRERTDGRLTRFVLTSEPPHYLYIRTTGGSNVIMEFARIAPVIIGYGLFAKGMYLLDDEIHELKGDNYVCRYEGTTEIREATDAECKRLVQARDAQKKRKVKQRRS